MPTYTQPIDVLIQKRFSCRKYRREPIPVELQAKLKDFIAGINSGLFGAKMRFELIATEEQDPKALRGLGTYGFIQGASGFVVGALSTGSLNLEEYGYRMEQIVLAATDLGLGTCWLGGTFTKSSFARKIDLQQEESIPAILSIGLMEDENQARQGVIRQYVAGHQRFAWEQLFFAESWGVPLTISMAGDYALPLEMVRLGPSASNKQPWRVVHNKTGYHFFIQRTKGYRNIFTRLVQVEDMQRLDMGIAMCHFELTAKALGLSGKWGNITHGITLPENSIEYSMSWLLTT